VNGFTIRISEPDGVALNTERDSLFRKGRQTERKKGKTKRSRKDEALKSAS
jgi:hypothetical protein